jgi:hypothetical protein
MKKIMTLAMGLILPLSFSLKTFAGGEQAEADDSSSIAIVGAGGNLHRFNNQTTLSPSIILGLSVWDYLGSKRMEGAMGKGLYHFSSFGNINLYSYDISEKEGKGGVSGSLSGRMGAAWLPFGAGMDDLTLQLGVSSGYDLSTVSGLYSQGTGQVDMALTPGVVLTNPEGVISLAPLIGLNGNSWQFKDEGQELMLNMAIGLEAVCLFSGDSKKPIMLKLRHGREVINLYKSEEAATLSTFTSFNFVMGLTESVQLLLQFNNLQDKKNQNSESARKHESINGLIGLGYSF